ncbi:MAG TPA: GNAT family N-acetyltransferase [Longimicrobiales bacterium]|nr:GNAT family N-acetyltransferase [Longimicrobiales bacterium]
MTKAEGPTSALRSESGRAPEIVAETERLVLRRFVLDDAPFIARLLNEPGFLRYIGDRGVRTVDDARSYLEREALESYRVNGFGLFAVELKTDWTTIGACGLLRRPWLEAPDLAYAFLASAEGFGYASEAARAVLDLAWSTLALERVVAIVLPDHAASTRILEKLHFQGTGSVTDPRSGEELALFRVSRDEREPAK